MLNGKISSTVRDIERDQETKYIPDISKCTVKLLLTLNYNYDQVNRD